jgi:hypothetical protein
VAFTSGTDVTVSAKWIHDEMNGEAVGSLVHEAVHVVQQYGAHGDGSRPPGWMVEGTADYIRWFKYEPQSHGADLVYLRLVKSDFRFDDSYRISANFLNWVAEKHDKDLVVKMNAAMRQGQYDDSLWKKFTGETVQELGADWKKDLETQLAAGHPAKPAG